MKTDCLDDVEKCIHCGQYHDVEMMTDTDKGYVCVDCIDFHEALSDDDGFYPEPDIDDYNF